MVQILFNFWRNLQTKSKLFLVAVIILLCFVMYYASTKAYYKYKYFKQVEKELTISKNEIKNKDIIIDSIIANSKQHTKTVRKKATSIDSKLKQDEKTIDDTVIDDDALNEFITKHSN